MPFQMHLLQHSMESRWQGGQKILYIFEYMALNNETPEPFKRLLSTNAEEELAVG
jgi:hypothetical protein